MTARSWNANERAEQCSGASERAPASERPATACVAGERTSWRYDANLMFVGEDEAVGGQLQSRRRFAALPRHRIGAEQTDVLDDVDTRDPLQHAERITRLSRTAPRPALSVGAADERIEVAVQRGDGVGANAFGIGARRAAQPRDHRDALVGR